MSRTRIHRVKGDVERRMVIGAITSDAFLRRVQPVYQRNLLSETNLYVATVMQWCMDYWRQYGKAPGKDIEAIYHAEVKKGMDEDRAELIADLLESVSTEYEQGKRLNVEYLLDKVRDRFACLAADALADEIKDGITNGEIKEVETAIARYKKIELASATAVNPFTDADAIYTAFEDATEPIIRFKGAMGQMINDALTRDSLIGIMASEKKGKTWQLMDFAFAGIRARRNVAFFGVGDMSREQMIVRMLIRLTGRNNRARYCEEKRVPVLDCRLNQMNKCRLKCRTGTKGLGYDFEAFGLHEERAARGYKPCSACQRSKRLAHRYQGSRWFSKLKAVQPLTWKEALQQGKRLFRRMAGKHFFIDCYPNCSVSVTDIRNKLDVMEASTGFVPDVVIIDYADILLPEPESGQKEHRHNENAKWQALRRLSQERHCLVVTATQANAKAYEKGTLSEANFSEDKRKYGHVTGMIGLNQTKGEKEDGILRINWLMLREGEFSVRRSVCLLQCLARGMTHMGSYWDREKRDGREDGSSD